MFVRLALLNVRMSKGEWGGVYEGSDELWQDRCAACKRWAAHAHGASLGWARGSSAAAQPTRAAGRIRGGRAAVHDGPLTMACSEASQMGYVMRRHVQAACPPACEAWKTRVLAPAATLLVSW